MNTDFFRNLAKHTFGHCLQLTKLPYFSAVFPVSGLEFLKFRVFKLTFVRCNAIHEPQYNVSSYKYLQGLVQYLVSSHFKGRPFEKTYNVMLLETSLCIAYPFVNTSKKATTACTLWEQKKRHYLKCKHIFLKPCRTAESNDSSNTYFLVRGYYK